jgi:hypothetical protein
MTSGFNTEDTNSAQNPDDSSNYYTEELGSTGAAPVQN